CFLVCIFSSRRRHTRFSRDWSSDVCSSDLGHVGGVPHLLSCHPDCPGKALAAVVRGKGQGVPATLHIVSIGRGKAFRRADHPVLQDGADLVSLLVERCQQVRGQLPCFLQNGFHQIGGRVLVAWQGRDLRQFRDLLQDETHLRGRG